MPLYQLDHPDLQSAFAELQTNRAVAHNLPASLTSLVGRDAETAEVSALLDDHRLVTLLGEGGCGKTRLALRVGAAGLSRFVDGVWFIDLSALRPGADSTSRVAQTIGVEGGLEELVAALDQMDVLLVLDNCEHVVESTATLVATLLVECPMTKVVATSRVVLNLAGEVCYLVPPLEVPRRGANLREAQATTAVELFTTRAQLARPGYQLGERDVEAIVELCTRLEGLPLAIELAAARLRGMSLTELVGRIDDRFEVLIGGPRSAPQRHQTLRNTVGWSFRLLDADEERVVRALSAFRGGCDTESAEAVCARLSSGDVLDVLIRLVNKSLVIPVDVDGTTRYCLHETVREYALASLSPADREAVHEEHARWFSVLASRLRDGPAAGGEQSWIRRHADECDNLRAAAEWWADHDPPRVLRLLVDVEPGVDQTLRSMWHEELLREVLPRASSSPPGDRAAGFALLAWTDSDRGLPNALDELQQAVELLGDTDDPVAACYVLPAVARCHAQACKGELDSDELAAAAAAGDRVGGTFWPIMIRHFVSSRASPAISEALITDALSLAEQRGLNYFAALIRGDLAMVAQFRGDSTLALDTWSQAVNEIDDQALSESHYACFYALAKGEHGEVAVGLHLAEHFVLGLTRGPHDPERAAAIYSVIAHLCRLAGDREGAEAALEAASRAGAPPRDFVGGLALVTRSALWRECGQPRMAASAIEQATDHIGFHGSTDIAMRVVEELAAVAVSLKRHEDAANLLATAREARERYHMPVSPACRPEVDALQTMVGALHATKLSVSDATALAHSFVEKVPRT